MNIYVVTSYQATEHAETFSNNTESFFGEIITDKVSGRSRNFAFVEMDNDDEAREAIENLNGKNSAAELQPLMKASLKTTGAVPEANWKQQISQRLVRAVPNSHFYSK